MSRILLIDDDSDMLTLTARWLEKAGYEVIKAASGSEALSSLETESYDLILLDYAMPGMDGPAVLRAIREKEGCKNTQILLYILAFERNSLSHLPHVHTILFGSISNLQFLQNNLLFLIHNLELHLTQGICSSNL